MLALKNENLNCEIYKTPLRTMSMVTGKLLPVNR